MLSLRGLVTKLFFFLNSKLFGKLLYSTGLSENVFTWRISTVTVESDKDWENAHTVDLLDEAHHVNHNADSSLQQFKCEKREKHQKKFAEMLYTWIE